jgi:glycerol-3-phosphate O-acyltransferase
MKNHVLHHFVPEAIVALASSAEGARADKRAVRDTARALSRLLKLEFIFRPGAQFDELFDEAVARAVSAGLLVDDGAIVAVADRGARAFGRNLLLGFVECYAAVFDAVPRASDPKGLAALALEEIRGRVIAGEAVSVEAASKSSVDNAIQLLIESGVLSAAPWRVDEPQLASLAALVARFTRRPVTRA